MHILKRLFRTFISSIFKTLLFLTAVIAAISMLATKPETIKSTLSSSKAYDNVVDAVIESSADALDKDKKQDNNNIQPNNPGPNNNNGNQDQNKEEEKSLDINRPEVVSAAKTAFTPAFLQASTEEFIDGMFNWATGKTPEPDFSIDFGPAKTAFISSLADNAMARASKLPVCTAAQLPSNGDFDPLNDECLPPGTDLANISTSIKNDLNNGDFLSDTTLTSEIFTENGESKLPDFVPTIYKLVSLAPLALGGLAILFAFFLWLLHERKRDGLKSIAISLTGVGVFILINTLLLDFLFKQINHSNKVLSLDNATRQLALGVIDGLNTTVNKSLYIFGGSYIALGVVILFILFVTGRKNRVQSTDSNNRPQAKPAKTGNTPVKTMPATTPSKPAPSAPPLPKRTKK